MLRKYGCVGLSNKIEMKGYIPGMGQKSEEQSVALVGGGGVKELAGVGYHIVGGAVDS
ncbi:uS12 family ribosomal protein [Staphylococcus capitis]|uniref:hypothetical protein n=1 Tax=Staphylococcus capitis TaxID=29388 RepID=UPI00119F7862|nr:hypothetical protein [Staphylococcus capitis]